MHAARTHRHGVARLSAGRAARASSTAIACTVRTIRGAGHRFNPNKIVARSVRRGRSAAAVRWDDSVFGYTIGDPDGDLSFDTRDNAAFAPLAAVIDPAFTWGDDRPPRTPWHKTVIYEMHVKGFTKLHPDVPEAAARHLRGADHRAGDRASAAARRHRRGTDAGASPRLRPSPGRARAVELLGLQHAGVLRARHSLFGVRAAGRIGRASSSGW